MTVRPLDDFQAEELLVGLLERYSPSRQEASAATYLVERMRELGMWAEVDGAGNAVGQVGTGKEMILLLGHIDTVPGHIPVRRYGDLLYGRGAVDAKGPLAAFVVAATRARLSPGRAVKIVGAVEEEAATSRGARYLLDRLSPACVVIGEPSGWERITVGYKGRLLLNYRLTRRMGHSAGRGRNAVEEAVAFWNRVVAYADAHNAGCQRMFEQLTPALRRLNTADDCFYQTVTMTIGLRLPPGIDIAELQAELRAVAGDAGLNFYGHEAAFRASKSTSLVRAFLRAIRAEGGDPRFQVKSGTSDMNVVGPVWRCPILAYGPGDSALDHTPDEHLKLSEYHRAIAVLTRVLADI